ncbi:antitoxin [Streptomyces sp. CB01635]|uniref:type II toxin-antitoxin system VapB family antitoxin n=1 Tax=unclassified Streptomyces TaxID=2593676 RepID=UPI000C2776DD|nr:type II toxin-antitoxin system VapB family antitoxin [Streptomyces sp. CB01635]PJN10538.1 antitoxin [Streptomyces sp. CB01635]
MAATQIDMDDEALAEAAMRLSGARTKKETVNRALREYGERQRRAEARLRHFKASQDWDDESFRRLHAAEKGTA